MLPVFFDDPLFRGVPRPDLTGSYDLTGITSSGQRHVMPDQGLAEKTTGQAGISQREESEMGKWTVIFRDKDSGELKIEPVSGWIGGAQRNEELREEGHETVGWRKSLGTAADDSGRR